MDAGRKDAGSRCFDVVRPALFALAALALLTAALASRADAFVYWTNLGNDTIGRANNDGTGINPSFISVAPSLPGGVAVDSTYIYWVESDAGSIGRAKLDGTGVNQNFIATDTVGGGSGSDTISGGPGNDKINARDGDADRIDCGAGTDTVKLDSKDTIVGASSQNSAGSCQSVVGQAQDGASARRTAG